jgi:teichoic acid transport system ATP-binding protein
VADEHSTPPTHTGLPGAPAGTATIRADDLHVRYRVYHDVKPTLRSVVTGIGRRRRYQEVHAVKGVSFTAHTGEAIGVIGPNGSGKSTLMQAIAGLLPASDGAVYASSMPMLLGVGAVLNKRLSGRRNILLGGLALGLTREEVAAREAEIIEFAGIGEAVDRPMKTYSSGMQSRLQFAISSAVEPEILIIDEALSVGDADFKRKSEARIRQLRESAGTVFLVTHSMGSIRATCTRVLWLQDGELRADGPPDEVIEQYREAQVERREREGKPSKRKHSDKTKSAKQRRKARKRAKMRAKYERQWTTLVELLTDRGMTADEAEALAATVWPRVAEKRNQGTDDPGPDDALGEADEVAPADDGLVEPPERAPHDVSEPGAGDDEPVSRGGRSRPVSAPGRR